MANHPSQPPSEPKTGGFYFLVVLLVALATFIGYNFGGVIGGVIGFLFSCIINAYALQIKED